MNKIIRGDTLELIHELKDETVDLIICDGPYGVTKNKWDNPRGGIQEFNLGLIKTFTSKLKPGGTLYLFGKNDCLDFIDYRPYLKLQSKIVWYQPSRLAQGRINYTGSYDIIAYFIKGARAKCFNLEEIRVPHLVELTHRKRCENVPSVKNGTWGKTKFNPVGKNPGDVWGDIKQLTYKSKELMRRDALNTIQKPEALIARLILASSKEGDLVLDPFCGTGTCPALCVRLQRDFISFENNAEYVSLARQRVTREKKLLKN